MNVELKAGEAYRVSYPVQGEGYRILMMRVYKSGMIELERAFTDDKGEKHSIYLDSTLVKQTTNLEGLVKSALKIDERTVLTVTHIEMTKGEKHD